MNIFTNNPKFIILCLLTFFISMWCGHSLFLYQDSRILFSDLRDNTQYITKMTKYRDMKYRTDILKLSNFDLNIKNNSFSTPDKYLLAKLAIYPSKKYRYVSDMKNYDKEDYWASPFEFEANGGGDCEDFAIYNYYTLKVNGFDDKKMFLGAYTDNRNDKSGHLILIVKLDQDYVIDNNYNYVRLLSDYNNIYPNFMINEHKLYTR